MGPIMSNELRDKVFRHIDKSILKKGCLEIVTPVDHIWHRGKEELVVSILSTKISVQNESAFVDQVETICFVIAQKIQKFIKEKKPTYFGLVDVSLIGDGTERLMHVRYVRNN